MKNSQNKGYKKHRSLHRRSGIKAGTAPDSPIRARLSARFFAKSLSFAAADRFTAIDGDCSPSMQIFTGG